MAEQTDPENHRTRVGRERRLKTGRRILEAVFDIVDRDGVDQLSIDRVSDISGLSRGGLYGYATHSEDLLVRIAHLIWKQVRLEQAELAGPHATPLERMSGSLRYGIIRSIGDSAIGPILFKALAWNSSFNREMRGALLADLTEAKRLEMVDVDALDTAADLAMGMMTAIMHHALVNGPSSAKLSEQAVIMFRALGVSRVDAYALAKLSLPRQPSTTLREKVLLASWTDR